MTGNDFEWFQRVASNFSTNDANRTQLLSEFKLAFSALNGPQQKLIAHSLKLDHVFNSLNSPDTEQVELTCEVLALLLSALECSVVFGQYEEAMHRALGHSAPVVKLVVLKELQRAVGDGSLAVQLSQQTALLLSAVACVCHEDMSVATSAVRLLVTLGTSATGLDVLFSSSMLQALKGAMAQQDVIRFRIYEVVVDVAVHSPGSLQRAHASGLLTALISELNGSDILLQMNALELLTKLALCEHGLPYLQQQGVLRSLANKVTSISEDPLASLTLPGLIKFFGNVAQSRPKQVFAEYPSMVKALFETFDSQDLVLVGVAMETVGYIGTSLEGKYMLASQGDTMEQTMKNLAVKIANLPTEWRVRALNTVANLLQLKPADQDNRALSLTQSWFEAMSSNPMELVMSMCRQPFLELRLAGLQVLQVLAEQLWGQEAMNSYPGLVEFLLDRSIEANKPSKDSKYEIVKTIVESPTAGATFGNVTLLRLREFVREGPFYVQAQTEVAIEGAS